VKTSQTTKAFNSFLFQDNLMPRLVRLGLISRADRPPLPGDRPDGLVQHEEGVADGPQLVVDPGRPRRSRRRRSGVVGTGTSRRSVERRSKITSTFSASAKVWLR
jgi:hypothetical protein